jgi:hypothetical protein
MTCGAAELSTFFGRVSRALEGLLARWRSAVGSSHYRPEKYYMRGPGPKNLSNPPARDNDSGTNRPSVAASD